MFAIATYTMYLNKTNVAVDPTTTKTKKNKNVNYAGENHEFNVRKKNDKQKGFIKIFKKIISNEFLKKESVIYSDQEFDQLLEKLNVRKEDIEWMSVGYGSTPQISVILYPDAPFNHLISKKQQNIVMKELGKDPDVETREIPAEFICFPIKENIDFEVTKVEHWQMNKYKKNKLLKIEYRFFKPGILREDLVRDEDSEKIEEAIKILQANKLIQPTMFAQEERYVVSDPELKNLIWIIIKAFESFYNTLLIKIPYFDEPNEREDNIMNEYLGQERFKKIKDEKKLQRYEYRKGMKECNNLNEYCKLLVEDDIANGTNLSLITDIEDIFYERGYLPIYNDKNTSIEDFDNYYKKSYKELLLKSSPKEEVKKLIEDYHNHIKEKVYKELKWLPVSFEGKGLEKIKMDYENIIKKYSFLKEIIDPIFGSVDDVIV